MIDNFMVERWNVIDSAAMAVSVEGLLYRIIHDKPQPFDFEDALNHGINFLQESGRNCGLSPAHRCLLVCDLFV